MKDHAEVESIILRHLKDKRGKVVLLAGPWGCGKTHLWKTKLVPALVEEQPISVSLFGVESTQTLKNMVMNESLLRRLVKLTDKDLKDEKKWLGFIAGGLRKGAEILLRKDFFDRLDAFQLIGDGLVICLDDVERASRTLPIEEILGVANILAETKNARVLLLMNEAHILERDASAAAVMSRFRERVVFARITVDADFEAAFDLIASEIWNDPRTAASVVAERSAILAVFAAAQSSNLRTLIRVLSALKMFADQYQLKELNHRRVVFLTALMIEVDSGSLKDADFYSFNEIAIRMFPPRAGDQAHATRLAFLQAYYGLQSKVADYEFVPELHSYFRTGYHDSKMREVWAPTPIPLDPVANMLRDGQEKIFFFSDAQFRDWANRVETLIRSQVAINTAQLVTLFSFLKEGAERSKQSLVGDLDELIRQRLRSNAAAGDSSFTTATRHSLGSFVRFWEPFAQEFQRETAAARAKAETDELAALVRELKADEIIGRLLGRTETLRLLVKEPLLTEVANSWQRDRKFHYFVLAQIAEELGKYPPDVMGDIAEARAKFSAMLARLESDENLDNGDRTRVQSILEKTRSWPSSVEQV